MHPRPPRLMAVAILGLLLASVGFTALQLQSCKSFGDQAPQTFNQRLAYAIGVHTSILQASAAAVSAGTLSSTDAQAVLTQADTAKTVLDAAKVASAAGDALGADNKLAAALTVLTALQTYLNTHGAHGP